MRRWWSLGLVVLVFCLQPTSVTAHLINAGSEQLKLFSVQPTVIVGGAQADRATPQATARPTPLRWIIIPGGAGVIGGLVLLWRTFRQRHEPALGLSFGQKLAWSIGTLVISGIVLAGGLLLE